MPHYLCYDLKGVQSFIFRVPKLRYIVGGSALLDQFDRETVRGFDAPDTKRIFSGGGKGAFQCRDTPSADGLQTRLVDAAHAIGADISFGRHADLAEAMHLGGSVHPFLPHSNQLDGHPCPDSGLLPVPDGRAHWSLRKRIHSRDDLTMRRYERELLETLEPHPAFHGREPDFFHDVSPDGERENEEARAASRALGSRNRWAVITMDGNDLGEQFRRAVERPVDDLLTWAKGSSEALDRCSRRATVAAIERVVAEWASDHEVVKSAFFEEKGREYVLLPVRPLIVGGDDVKVLCHVDHAFTFVQELVRAFAVLSHEENERWKREYHGDLWLATGGELSISAGVLFSPVSLPLSTALHHAESLLAMAKHGGRSARSAASRPSPAFVDWETVTASVLEGAADSRRRDYAFEDLDLKARIELTRRPYPVSELPALQQRAERLGGQSGKGLPRTIVHQLRTGLRQAYWDREIWRARLGKNHQALHEELMEPEQLADGATCGSWQVRGGTRATDILDVVDLLVEKQRMDWMTGEE